MRTEIKNGKDGYGKAVELLALLIVLLFSSCQNAPEYKQGERIVYYPGSNTYLDLNNHVYLLFDTVEQQWKQQPELVEDVRARLGPSVPVDAPTVPVYRDNAKHRLLYGTALYANDSLLARNRREDSMRTTLPAAADPNIPEPRKKTKVGRFLQKIFGRKEKG